MSELMSIPAPSADELADLDGEALTRLYADTHGSVPKSQVGHTARELTLRLLRLINHFREQCLTKPVPNTGAATTATADPKKMLYASFLMTEQRPRHQQPTVYHVSWWAMVSRFVNLVAEYGEPTIVNTVIRDGLEDFTKWEMGDDDLPLSYSTTIGEVPVTVIRIQHQLG